MRRNEYTIEAPLASELLGVNSASDSINLKGWDGYAVTAQYAVSAPSADVVASTGYVSATNSVTSTAHGFKTGLLGALTTDGALPTGLTETDYYLITVNANAYQFATTAANAGAGTFVTFVDGSKSGNETFTPAAANVSIQLQGSIDNSTYICISSENVTTSATKILWNIDQPHYLYARVQYIINAGQGTFQVDSVKETYQ